jgi:hypothetical protein
MCQIAVCEKRPLTEKEIDEFWRSNSDGAGVAWFEGGKVHYKKGFMKLEEFKKWYMRRCHYLNLHVVHFRLKSSGDRVPELTHPFPVEPQFNLSMEGTADAVLFHNGTVSDYRNYLILLSLIKGVKIPKHVSDSAVMAVLVYYCGENILNEGYNRFALLRNGEVELFGSWKQEDGIMLSSYYTKTKWCRTDDLWDRYKGF